MLSALRMVDRRWATMTVVRPTMSESNASCTSFSLAASRAEVASSRRRMRGFPISARAIATRCFCPPLSSPPLSPHKRAIPSGLWLMNSMAFALTAAASISVGEASSFPYRMFSPIVVAKRIGSCETRLIWERRCLRLNSFVSMPSMSTCPAVGS
mmetsp:Transcript_26216/g.53434  ORF Transcript_26216/g.53434 Transcript_26216/m.53434 type:complete len:155 (-) Transcript_26216:570-1034(-)